MVRNSALALTMLVSACKGQAAPQTATELCTITCENKAGCGLLNPTTMEECISGC